LSLFYLVQRINGMNGFFWFPRAGVGIQSRRASVAITYKGRRRVPTEFPRRRVGTRKLSPSRSQTEFGNEMELMVLDVSRLTKTF